MRITTLHNATRMPDCVGRTASAAGLGRRLRMPEDGEEIRYELPETA
jgi:hypothetical protein